MNTAPSETPKNTILSQWKNIISSSIIVLLLCLSALLYLNDFICSRNLDSKVRGLNFILGGQSGYYMSQIAFLDKTNEKCKKELEDIEMLMKKNPSLANDKLIRDKMNGVISLSRMISDAIKETRRNALLIQFEIENFQNKFLKTPKKR